MKHCEFGKTTQYMYSGHKPLKILSFDNPLTTSNKIRRPNQCGATVIASVTLTTECVFYIHNLDKIKLPKKLKDPTFTKIRA